MTGFFPFTSPSKSQEEVAKNILKGKFQFPSFVDNLDKRLISGLLQKNKTRRISLKQIIASLEEHSTTKE
jgi:serine/threonine protein kinase